MKSEDNCFLAEKWWQTLDRVLKSRDITLPTKVCIATVVVFPVVMYRCESWTVKKAELQRTDAFKLSCWSRLLKVSWAARSNQSILREITEYSLMLKLLYFGHLMRTTDSLEKSLMLGKIEGKRRRGRQEDEMAGQHHWCNKHELGQTPGDGEGQRGLVCCSPWGCKDSGMIGWLNNNNNNNSVLKCRKRNWILNFI